jgi:glycosyltransferase involved in cell wall biosynthesis
MGWGYLTSKRHVPWTRRLLSAFALAWRPEVIHVHSYVYDLNVTHVLEWTHARRMPTVFEEHQTPDPTRDVWRDFQARIDLATMVGAVSNQGAAVMREHLGVRRPIRVLPALVDDPMPALAADRIVPTPSATPTITTFARLIPVKGLTHLFEAIAALRTTHPQLRFRVYGEGPPRSREEIRTDATHWGLDPADVFAGTFRRAELPGIMAATDVFVLSSLMEGFPLAIVEAMACGRAIVATAVGGVPDLIQDGVTGLLCPPGDAASLTRTLHRLLDDPVERARLGRAARTAYEQGPFHPRHATRDYLAMYDETLRLARERP